jgi:hypothetical protein
MSPSFLICFIIDFPTENVKVFPKIAKIHEEKSGFCHCELMTDVADAAIP